MSSYATLLENYVDESSIVSFEELGAMLESLSDFVNEEVNLNVEISLQEAEEETIKDKAGKVGAAVKRGIENLIKKLQAFITKIGEAAKQFAAKASIVIKQGGNKALAKMAANSSYVIKKEVKLISVDTGKIKKIISSATTAANQISQNIANVNAVPTTVEGAINDLGEKLEKSDLVVAAGVSSGTVKQNYAKHVKPYLDIVDSAIKGEGSIIGICKKAQADAKKIIGDLKKEKDVDSGKLATLSALSSAAMKLSTRALMFGNSVLSIATKNGAKLALAAADASGKAAVQRGKNKVNDAKAKVDQKVKNVKADIAEKKAAKAEAKAAKEAEK